MKSEFVSNLERGFAKTISDPSFQALYKTELTDLLFKKAKVDYYSIPKLDGYGKPVDPEEKPKLLYSNPGSTTKPTKERLPAGYDTEMVRPISPQAGSAKSERHNDTRIEKAYMDSVHNIEFLIDSALAEASNPSDAFMIVNQTRIMLDEYIPQDLKYLLEKYSKPENIDQADYNRMIASKQLVIKPEDYVNMVTLGQLMASIDAVHKIGQNIKSKEKPIHMFGAPSSAEGVTVEGEVLRDWVNGDIDLNFGAINPMILSRLKEFTAKLVPSLNLDELPEAELRSNINIVIDGEGAGGEKRSDLEKIEQSIQIYLKRIKEQKAKIAEIEKQISVLPDGDPAKAIGETKIQNALNSIDKSKTGLLQLKVSEEFVIKEIGEGYETLSAEGIKNSLIVKITNIQRDIDIAKRELQKAVTNQDKVRLESEINRLVKELEIENANLKNVSDDSIGHGSKIDEVSYEAARIIVERYNDAFGGEEYSTIDGKTVITRRNVATISKDHSNGQIVVTRMDDGQSIMFSGKNVSRMVVAETVNDFIIKKIDVATATKNLKGSSDFNPQAGKAYTTEIINRRPRTKSEIAAHQRMNGEKIAIVRNQFAPYSKIKFSVNGDEISINGSTINIEFVDMKNLQSAAKENGLLQKLNDGVITAHELISFISTDDDLEANPKEVLMANPRRMENPRRIVDKKPGIPQEAPTFTSRVASKIDRLIKQSEFYDSVGMETKATECLTIVEKLASDPNYPANDDGIFVDLRDLEYEPDPSRFDAIEFSEDDIRREFGVEDLFKDEDPIEMFEVEDMAEMEDPFGIGDYVDTRDWAKLAHKKAYVWDSE